jgi:hypothetical protein
MGTGEAGTFRATLLLIDDLDSFMASWNTSITPAKVQAATSVNVGSSVEAIIFSGCAPDPEGNCQLYSETVIVGDFGKVPAEPEPKPIWTDGPPPRGVLSFGETSVSIIPNGSPSQVEIRVKVTDRVSGDFVVLAVPMTVQ